MPGRQPVIDREGKTGSTVPRGARSARGKQLILCALLLIVASATQAALALDPNRSLNHYGHQVWHSDSGLPQNTVHTLLQSREGYLWLGTDGGLVRFDGVDFVTFNIENTPELKSDLIYDLLQDDTGAAWISTAAGLARYRDGRFQSYTSSEGLPADTVWFSYQDQRHRIWAVTSAGPAYFTGTRFVPLSGAESAAPLNRHALAEDAQGTLWLGGASGVFAIDVRPATPRIAQHLLTGSEVAAVEFDPGGTVQSALVQPALWIGTNDGLTRYAGGRLVPVPMPSLTAKTVTTARTADMAGLTAKTVTTARTADMAGLTARTEIMALTADKTGGLWAGSSIGLLHIDSHGVARVLPDNGQPVGHVDHLFVDRQGVLWLAAEREVFRLSANHQSLAPVSALSGSRVLTIYEDREGDLWLGTDSSGLHLLRDQKFTTYTTSDGLSGNLARCVFQSNNGDLWIGTDGAGLNRRISNGMGNNSGFIHYTAADGLSSNVILSLAGGPNGDLWIGTPDGLNLLHPGPHPGPDPGPHLGPHLGQSPTKGKVEKFTTADGLPDDFIRSLYSDPDGSLWIGTRHGLAHRTGGRFTSYSRLDGLGSDFIGAILRQDGDLWVGTSGGLSRIRGDAFTNYTARQGLSDNVVTAITQGKAKESAAAALWLGTNGGGLNRLLPSGIQSFPSGAQSLPGTIYGILDDGKGELWLSSKTGIYRVAAEQLNAYADGKAKALSVTSYDTADGMNIRECSGGGHPAAWMLQDGSLWFATLDGVSSIDPAHTPENRVPPLVMIEKVLVNDQARNPYGELTLPPGANRLEFAYAGLSFVAPQKVRYRYQLEGFDHTWIEAGNRRSAFYTNLPPGRYRFRVIAANNDGVWNTGGASFELRLQPHFYQTWWFYSALGLGCMVLGYLAYRWRVLQVEAQFGAVLAERGRLAREIHDTLAQGFVGVSVQLELVSRLMATSREAAMTQLDQARALVRTSLDEARASIWNLRSQGGSAQNPADDLPSRLSQSCSRMGGASSAKVYLQVKGTYRPVSRKIEDELLRIGQEAVANAVRHAAATRIDVQLMYEGKRVSLEVRDDGQGFEPSPRHSGPEGHYGIRGMQERAGEIHAALVLESTPGAGTRVSVEAPLA